MCFQIESLDPTQFARFFAMTDDDLANHRARKVVVTAKPGTPCRVSLQDAEIGETVLLVNYEHQPANSPYWSNHAIFVRQQVPQAQPALGEVPEVLLSRLVSVRLFDPHDMMIDADVVAGTALHAAIVQAFDNPQVSYLHLHYAKPGCFAARVRRA